MPAASENRLTQVRQLGIIAGGGGLPERLASACEQKGIVPFIIGFEGQTDPSLVQNRNHIWTRLGAAGHVLKILKLHEITDLVLIGAIRRPSFSELVPDFRTIEFFARAKFRAWGDNDLLSAVRKLLEDEGFTIHGIHEFAENLLADEGVLGQYSPRTDDWIDIDKGLEISQILGSLDVGQSVIVQEGIVLAVEAAEGTDELIRRCKCLKRQGRGGVLVKTCKPQQDKNLDLPTIGPETVRTAAEAGLSGIVIHAGQTLVIDPEELVELANELKIFVIGINPSARVRHG